MDAIKTADASHIRHGQIDDTAVPGTIHLLDADQTIRAKHADTNREIVLVPAPSEDPGNKIRTFRDGKF